MACRRWHLVQCGSLAFATSVVDTPHRIETPAKLLFRGIPVRAVRSRLSRSEDRPRRFRTPLLGFIDRPSVDTTVLRRPPPEPSPRLRIGTATSRSCSAPAVPPGFSGLLRSEQIRRSTRSTVRGFVAPRSRPWGSPRFGLPDSASQPSLRPEGRGPEGPFRESSPVARTLRSVPLLGSLRPCRHRASSFRTWSRSPAGVPSRRWSGARFRVTTARCTALDLRAFFHRGVRCVHATLPSRDARCSLGLWIDSFFRRCRAYRAAQLSLDIPPGGPNRFGVPSPEREGKAGCFGPVWLHATSVRLSPKGRPCSIAVAPANLPKESPRPHPRRATKGMPVNLPREEIHRVGPYTRRRPVSDVIATHLRRDSFATQRSLRRAAAGGSSSFPPSFRGCPRT
jgi:hypothetical protein